MLRTIICMIEIPRDPSAIILYSFRATIIRNIQFLKQILS